jgi:hypothetical protein
MSNKLIKKNHGSAFKFNVVLYYLKGDQTAVELSRELRILQQPEFVMALLQIPIQTSFKFL